MRKTEINNDFLNCKDDQSDGWAEDSVASSNQKSEHSLISSDNKSGSESIESLKPKSMKE